MKLPTKIKKLLDPCRHFEDNQKKQMKGIVEYAVFAFHEIKRLEERIRRLEQPNFLDPPEDPYKGRTSTFEPLPMVEYSIEKHCAFILKKHGLEHKFTQEFMSRRQLTTARFLELAEKGEQKNENNED